MIGVIIGWSFFGFLYFKVVFDATFRADLSIISSLLMSIVFGFLVFAASGVYASKLLEFNWTPGRVPARLSQIIGRTFWYFLGMMAVYAIVIRLIIFGFSKRMNNNIDLFDYRGNIDEEFIVFLIIIFIPFFIHYAMCVFGTFNNANKKTSNSNQHDAASSNPEKLHFKSGDAFVEYQCKFGHTDIVPKKGIFAVVVDSSEEYGTRDAIKIEDDGRQLAMIKVASEDGGFVVPAYTMNGKGDRLKPDDVVIWVPMTYNEDLVRDNDLDQRFGWVGFILAKVKPEIDLASPEPQVVCEYQ